ncbi:MAG: putative dsRNA-binding protein, partial [[Eubacterium] siraeum]
ILPFIPPLDKLSTGKFLLGDYKTVLQEIIQQNPEERVTYEISDESGQAHNKQFTANVLLNGQIIGTGKGKSKKEAEQSAAKEAISLMGYETN